MTPEQFAQNEYRDLMIYRALALRERDADFKNVLEELARHEEEHFAFWRDISKKKTFSVHPFTVGLFRLMRVVLGLTFTARFLERRERSVAHAYQTCLVSETDPELCARIEAMITREKEHEEVLISKVREERVEFMSSIVLGLNDGLIELTGALVGFSFALQDPRVVALAGTITGVSASLSMASSAYLQARHEEGGKNPKKAGVYTGFSYLIVVVVLIAPFLLCANLHAAVFAMLVLATGIIAAVSFYSAVLFEHPYAKRFGEMLIFSLGVAFIAFVIGSLARVILGVEIG